MRSLTIYLFLIMTTITSAANWLQWRGPLHNGASNETNLPDSLNNPIWSTNLPGPSGATPIISKNQVFLTSMDTRNDGFFHAISIDSKTGNILWQKKIDADKRKLPRNNMATPSPATDGKSVFFLFGNGTLISTDYAGEIIWKRDLEADYGNLSVKYGYSSSPLLFDGKLYIVMMRRPWAYRAPETDRTLDSWILALDPDTGKNIWKVQRKSDAKNESFDSYASAVIFNNGDKNEIITVGGDYVTSHDPKTGKELWRYGYNPEKEEKWRNIPSAVTGEGLIFAVRARKGPLSAITSGSGSLTSDNIAWTFDGDTTDSPTPAYYKGNLYLLDGMGKTITCLEAKTGKVIWTGKLPGRNPYYASPTVADDKIYCLSEGGDAVIVAAGGNEFKIISETKFDEGPMQSTIAIADGLVFLRTAKKLYCFGK